MDFVPEVARAFSLEGKVAVVTGAGSGLGKETARLFTLAGAKVVIADLDIEGMAETRDLCGNAGSLIRQADVSRRDEMESLADWAAEQTGGLDIWVNGAGVSYLHSLSAIDEAQAQHTIAVNLMGSVWGCTAAARVMSQRGGGAIVNISSGGGSKPLPGIGIYGMTKAAVNSLTWTSAAEFGPLGVRVNAVAPGWIETPMSRDLFRDESGEITEARQEAVRREMRSKSPLGILGVPSDIAYALLYLASDASRFVTGQIIAVNGGESM